MEIKKKHMSDVSSSLKSVYHKAQTVMKNGGDSGLAYAVEILKGIVKMDPGFMEARESLRNIEKDLAAKRGAFAKIIGNFKIMGCISKGKLYLTKKDAKAAYEQAEDALAIDVTSPGALSLMAEAGTALNAPFIAIEALELISEAHPEDEANLKKLAEVCEAAGEGNKVLRIRQILADRHPDNLEYQGDLRAAAALATMEQGNWNDSNGSFTSKQKKNKSEVDELKRDDRIVRSEEDIKKMIEYYEGEIAKGDESIDNRRKLADYYDRIGRYDDAIKAYNWIVQKLGTLDPAIDKSIENCYVKKYNDYIAQLKKIGAVQEQIDQAQNEISKYRLDRAEDRVKNYPQDTMMRFELAQIYWEFGEVDKATIQFQQAQKNPNKRLEAIVYLGMCFFAKGQADMAIEQFEHALKEMPVLDDSKMNALYQLGLAYEAINDKAKAVDCFKEIYAVNVGYRDIGKRIEDYYAEIKAKREAEQNKA